MARRRTKIMDSKTEAAPEAQATPPEQPKAVAPKPTFVEIAPKPKAEGPKLVQPVVDKSNAVKELVKLMSSNPNLFVPALGIRRYTRTSSFVHDVKNGTADVDPKGRPCLRFGGFRATQIQPHEASEFNQEREELVIQVQDRFIGIIRG